MSLYQFIPLAIFRRTVSLAYTLLSKKSNKSSTCLCRVSGLWLDPERIRRSNTWPRCNFGSRTFAKLCLNTRWFVDFACNSWSQFFTLRVCRKFAWCDVKKSEDERLEWGWSCRDDLFIIYNFTWCFFISTLLCLFSSIYFVLSPSFYFKMNIGWTESSEWCKHISIYLNPKLPKGGLNKRS